MKAFLIYVFIIIIFSHKWSQKGHLFNKNCCSVNQQDVVAINQQEVVNLPIDRPQVSFS